MITDNIDGFSDGTTCSKMNLHVFSIEPMPIDDGCKYVLTCVDTDSGSYKYFHANNQELKLSSVSPNSVLYMDTHRKSIVSETHILQ